MQTGHSLVNEYRCSSAQTLQRVRGNLLCREMILACERGGVIAVEKGLRQAVAAHAYIRRVPVERGDLCAKAAL